MRYKKKGNEFLLDFFETHRCSELFFLYYFRNTSRDYVSQDELLKDLNKECGYRKKNDFFMKCDGLHSFFERNGGFLENAVKNADRSLIDREADGRDYTYSELGKLMKELKDLGMKKKV